MYLTFILNLLKPFLNDSALIYFFSQRLAPLDDFVNFHCWVYLCAVHVAVLLYVISKTNADNKNYLDILKKYPINESIFISFRVLWRLIVMEFMFVISPLFMYVSTVVLFVAAINLCD
jgi:hypothetical protein